VPVVSEVESPVTFARSLPLKKAGARATAAVILSRK
jgi:hypothetical protein